MVKLTSVDKRLVVKWPYGYLFGEKTSKGYNGTWKNTQYETEEGTFKELMFVSSSLAEGWMYNAKGEKAFMRLIFK